MSLGAYISFVELPTKIASVIPFVAGISYTLYRYGEINITNLVIMFISMITFDMATTAINNYCDYQNELKHMKDNYEGRNPMYIHNISNKIGLITIFTLLSIAIISGISLTIRTNLLVLVIGIICFFVGIFYTFGPIPISRMPLGEVFSGIFMGLLITFLTIYTTIYDKELFGIYIQGNILGAQFNLIELVVILIVSIPLIGGIANIMLANNICDLEDDVKVGRFTLPYYIGKNIAIKLYAYIYYIGYISTFVGVIIGILPKTCLLFLLTIYIVQKNISIFVNKQIKSETFITAVQNFTVLGIAYTISILIGAI